MLALQAMSEESQAAYLAAHHQKQQKKLQQMQQMTSTDHLPAKKHGMAATAKVGKRGKSNKAQQQAANREPSTKQKALKQQA